MRLHHQGSGRPLGRPRRPAHPHLGRLTILLNAKCTAVFGCVLAEVNNLGDGEVCDDRGRALGGLLRLTDEVVVLSDEEARSDEVCMCVLHQALNGRRIDAAPQLSLEIRHVLLQAFQIGACNLCEGLREAHLVLARRRAHIAVMFLIRVNERLVPQQESVRAREIHPGRFQEVLRSNSVANRKLLQEKFLGETCGFDSWYALGETVDRCKA
mmetsp:Transcript_6620/g.15261  ORF Transcript_6620/g.15261 Transcript_6620/m.15261 type:complete len:212 (-) Transcript_6620:114-749(-)